jgi:hypothetical protein
MRTWQLYAFRFSHVGLLAVAAIVVALRSQAQGPESSHPIGDSGAIAPPLVAAVPPAAPLANEGTATSTTRLREGTQLTDRMGYFRQNGEVVTFVDEDGRELGGLPNMSLERIIRMLKTVEEPESVKWSVSGAVTEFSGRNYLLISRAVYKAAMLPPMPDAVP